MKMILENYGPYAELVQKGTMTVYTKDLNDSNIDQHFQWIINILDDGIEKPEIQHLKLEVVFTDKKKIHLMIIDYMYNLMMWSIILSANHEISSFYFYNTVTQPVTKGSLKKYIDSKFIDINLKTMEIQ